MVREILIEILANCIGDNEISLEYDELLKMQVINIRTIAILVHVQLLLNSKGP